MSKITVLQVALSIAVFGGVTTCLLAGLERFTPRLVADSLIQAARAHEERDWAIVFSEELERADRRRYVLQLGSGAMSLVGSAVAIALLKGACHQNASLKERPFR